jgi:2-amino-4-hydroxy-6-hydroxymethyldihydropteridine diphosphokinase
MTEREPSYARAGDNDAGYHEADDNGAGYQPAGDNTAGAKSACDNGAGDNRTVVFSLGSNLGDRLAYLQLGLDVLASGGLDLVAVSSVYESDPVGGVEQADYLNAVLLASSSLPPRDILARCAAAEAAAGRVRAQRWGPRTLDVDIIACGCVVSTDPALTLPHPRAHERAFVLVPWLELDSRAALPGWGLVAGLLNSTPGVPTSTPGVRRRPEFRLTLPVPEADAPCS